MKLPWVSRQDYDELLQAYNDLGEASARFLQEYKEFRKQYEALTRVELPAPPVMMRVRYTLIKGGKE